MEKAQKCPLSTHSSKYNVKHQRARVSPKNGEISSVGKVISSELEGKSWWKRAARGSSITRQERKRESEGGGRAGGQGGVNGV